MLHLLLAASFMTGTDPAAIARAEAAFAMASIPTPAPVKQTVQQVVMHYGTNGHTHACPNKDCPFKKAYGEPYVWGGAGHAHTCAYCSAEQTVTSNRPITVVETVAAGLSGVPLALASLQSSSASAACASGQCSMVSSSPRRGIFRR